MKNKKILILMFLGFIFLFCFSLDFISLGSNKLQINQNSYNLINSPEKITLNIKEDNATLLNGSYVCLYEINVYRFVAQNITFNYTDATTNETLLDANASYTWYEKSDTSKNGNGTLIDLGNGLYTLNFNTSSRKVGEYIISVSIKKENYTKPNMVVSLNIKARPTTFLSLTGTLLSLERGIVFPILFYLEDSLNKTKLDDLSIRWAMGFFAGNLFPLGNGFYVLPFPTQIFEPGSNILIIDPSSNTNYDLSTTSVQINITWEKILGLDLPIFYAIVIISTIIVVLIVLYIVIRNLTKPFVIKKIDESLKKIEKNEKPISTEGIKSKEELYKEIFEKDWEFIRMKPKTKSK